MLLHLLSTSFNPSLKDTLVIIPMDIPVGTKTLVDKSIYNNYIIDYNSVIAVDTNLPSGVSSVVNFPDNSYYQITKNSSMNLTGRKFTLEMWVRPTTIGGGVYRRYFSYQPNTTNSVIIREASSGYLSVMLQFGYSTQYLITTTTAPTVNTWQHIALVQNSDSFVLYKNGVSIGSLSNSGTIDMSIHDSTISYISPESFIGQMAVLSLTNTAKYTSNFTPPQLPFYHY